MWTYATCCMSQPSDASPIELHMFSPLETKEVVELLYVTAHYHRTGARLDLGHTVNFGRPWLLGATASYGLVSRPYVDGPGLEYVQIGEKWARCLWLIPITRDEVEFKKLKGLETLERKFEEAGLDYLARRRDSVV